MPRLPFAASYAASRALLAVACGIGSPNGGLPDLDRILATGIEDVHRATVRNCLYQEMDYVDSLESHFRWDSMDEAEPATSHDLKLLPGEIVYSLTAWIKEGGRRLESARVYCRRGDAHLFQGALGLAEADFNRANIQL